MSSSKTYKDKQHSTVANSGKAIDDCSELKMIQLFKNDGESESRSLVFRISKFSQPQMPSSSKDISLEDGIVFSSQFSIQRSEENEVKSACSSDQICLSADIISEESTVHELHSSNDGDNKVNIASIQIPSSCFVKPFDEDKSFSSPSASTEDSDKYHGESVASPIEIPHLTQIKKEEGSPCESLKSSNDGKNQFDSLLLEKSKNSEMEKLLSSTDIPPDKSKTISYPLTNLTKNSRQFDTESVNSTLEMSMTSEIKEEIVPRRSLRLLELHSKSISSQESEDSSKISRNNFATKESPSTFRKNKRKMSVGNKRNTKKHATKQTPSMNDASSVPKITERKQSETSQHPKSLDPSSMKLKSLVLIPSSKTTPDLDVMYPKFANVDPSLVLPSVTQRKNIARSLKSGKVVSLFFPDKCVPCGIRSGQKKLQPTTNLSPQYKFKKANSSTLQQLKKKYPLIDAFTLDRCYDLSNFSIRKTEIMLLDVIAGKEVFAQTKNSECYCNYLSRRNGCANVPYFRPYWTPIPSYACVYEKKLSERSCSNDILCRQIIIQSLNILNDNKVILKQKI